MGTACAQARTAQIELGHGVSAIVDILDGIAASLETVMGTAVLGEDAIQIVARLNLNPAAPISIDIYPADPFRGTETQGFGEISGELRFTVRARATTTDTDAAQDQLLAMMDDENALSVTAALFADETLGGIVAELDVEGPTGYRSYGDNPGMMLGVEWTVTVINARS